MVPDVGCEGQSVLNCTVTKNLKRLVVLTFNLKTIPVISDINDVYHTKKTDNLVFSDKKIVKNMLPTKLAATRKYCKTCLRSLFCLF